MITRRAFTLSLLGASAGAAALHAKPQWRQVIAAYAIAPVAAGPADGGQVFSKPEVWAQKLIASAEGQIGKTVFYDGGYTRIDYPGGDVPIGRGVCTDVIIRSYREGLGIDLQRLVHEDMRASFPAYPKKWGLARPDSNIDHRRVPNLQTFFKRKGAALPVTDAATDYLPGDVVSMNLPGNLTHIALVTHRASEDGLRPLCVHNIGAGARLEDTLFAFELTGHYRFKPQGKT
jgi:uncharacterized protein